MRADWEYCDNLAIDDVLELAAKDCIVSHWYTAFSSRMRIYYSYLPHVTDAQSLRLHR